jgi:hypothetical protein
MIGPEQVRRGKSTLMMTMMTRVKLGAEKTRRTRMTARANAARSATMISVPRIAALTA